jgi:LURP-one-related
MIYVMKQTLCSWGDDFGIKDETGQDRFLVDSKAFSLGDQLSFQDSSGTELAYISQRLLNWGPTYEISRNRQLLATVHNELFTLFHCTFTIEGEERTICTPRETSRTTIMSLPATNSRQAESPNSGLRCQTEHDADPPWLHATGLLGRFSMLRRLSKISGMHGRFRSAPSRDGRGEEQASDVKGRF